MSNILCLSRHVEPTVHLRFIGRIVHSAAGRTVRPIQRKFLQGKWYIFITIMTLQTPTRPTVDNLNPLSNGSVLQEFVIERLIGIGGFGIVYLANDTLLHRKVAIKEYMPTSLASRGEGLTVSLRSDSYSDDFETGKAGFINEARMLARFKHPALLEVFRFWEQNNTAYMAMPFYEGLTLKESLRKSPNLSANLSTNLQTKLPTETTLRSILLPVLDALQHMHAEQVFHRDISPDNIMILDDGRPILLDLGAARAQQIETAQALTVLVKPGYAPIEQYAGDASVQQGAWTDIYGWGATAYFALTGKPPPPSASRIMSDSIVQLAQLQPDGYSEQFLMAVDAALAVRPDDRPQSIAALKSILGFERDVALVQKTEEPPSIIEIVQTAPVNVQVKVPVQAFAESPAESVRGQKSSHSKIFTACGIFVVALLGTFWWFAQPSKKNESVKGELATIVPAAQPPAVQVAPLAETVAKPVAVGPVTAASAPIAEQPAGDKPEADKPVVDKPAAVRFSVKPWGEVFVNGESKGVSPPLKSLSLPAGEYQIEVRNGDYPAFKTKIQAKAGETIRLNHAFVDTPQK